MHYHPPHSTTSQTHTSDVFCSAAEISFCRSCCFFSLSFFLISIFFSSAHSISSSSTCSRLRASSRSIWRKWVCSVSVYIQVHVSAATMHHVYNKTSNLCTKQAICIVAIRIVYVCRKKQNAKINWLRPNKHQDIKVGYALSDTQEISWKPGNLHSSHCTLCMYTYLHLPLHFMRCIVSYQVSVVPRPSLGQPVTHAVVALLQVLYWTLLKRIFHSSICAQLQ